MDRVQRIEQRFSRSVSSYDSSAIAQKMICGQLFSLIEPKTEHARVFEAGCGSGNLSQLLATTNPSQLILNDLCPSYKSILSNKLRGVDYQFIASDATKEVHSMIQRGERFDLIASTSAIQWFDNPIGFINQCAKLLHKGGVLAISTFSPNNLFEVCSITGRGLDYPSSTDILEGLDPEIEVTTLLEEDITLHFNSALEVLKHLKESGVTATSDRAWGVSQFHHFIEEYNRKFRREDNLSPLTYKPLYLICRKR